VSPPHHDTESFYQQPSLGFSAWRGCGARMERPHVHPDIEFNFVLHGEIEYLMADSMQTISAGTLAVFWAGMPHLMTGVAPDSEIIWVVLPLSWFLQWNLPSEFVAEIMTGRICRHQPPDQLDALLFGRWCAELPRPFVQNWDQAILHTAALEVESCLRRIARARPVPEITRPAVTSGEHSQFQRLASYINSHYADESLSIAVIAGAVGLHPNYAMHLFRARFGVSLWEYILRLRISHAQYLLLSTEKKVTQIAFEAGFSTPARFYAAFQKYAGTTPRSWRVENSRSRRH
jgi:AraC-like DNA-binding protein